MKRMEKKKVIFESDMEKDFDVIVFATGFKSAANKWLEDYEYLLNEKGMPKNEVPGHWKGERRGYTVQGFQAEVSLEFPWTLKLLLMTLMEFSNWPLRPLPSHDIKF
ncbi:hypothetical protein K1719_043242 [Acacia pycnantha]|nr:hypothetical protein K1719_043242 [Acacia pycnantha]